MNRNIRNSLLTSLLVCGASLGAQELTGSLSGHATDPEKRPLPGVTLIISSPKLFEARKVVTDEKGRWRVAVLPPGAYTITVSRKDYYGFTMKDIRVGMGTNQSLHLTLRPAQKADAVVVVESTRATAPALLSQSMAEANISVNFSGEQLLSMPLPRGGNNGSSKGVFDNVRDLTAGAIYTANNTVNGIRGTSGSGIAYSLDGIDVKDNFSQVASFAPMDDLIEDVQVLVSPVNASNGRVSGGSVRAVSKSGGNAFEGTIRMNLGRNSWRATRFESEGSGTYSGKILDDLARTWDVSLLGPIWKDHIWFTLGTKITSAGSPSILSLFPDTQGATRPIVPALNSAGLYLYNGNLVNVATTLLAGPGSEYSTPTWQRGQSVPVKGSDSKHYEGKLTARLFGDHILSASLNRTYSKTALAGYDLTSYQYFMKSTDFGPGSTDQTAYSLTWTGTLASNLSMELTFNKNKYSSITFAAPSPAGYDTKVFAATGTGAFSPAPQYFYGPSPLFGTIGKNQYRWNQGQNARFKWVPEWHGTHEVDFGVENVEMIYNAGFPSPDRMTRVTAGGYYADASGNYLFPTIRIGQNMTTGAIDATLNGQNRGPYALVPDMLSHVGASPLMIQFYGGANDLKQISQAVYLNDSWMINSHFTAMAGLRWNHFKGSDPTGATVLESKTLDPRFQMKWDPTGGGEHAFSFILARYTQEFTMNTLAAFSPTVNNVYSIRAWTGAALPGGAQPLPGDPNDAGRWGVRYVNYQQLTSAANFSDPISFSDPRQTINMRGIKPSFADEASVTYRRSLPGGFVQLALVQRKYKNDTTTASEYDIDDFQLVTDVAGGSLKKLQQRVDYMNSPQVSTYRGMELSWQQTWTARTSWMGSYNYLVQSGPLYSPYVNTALRDNTAVPLSQQDKFPEGVSYRTQRARVGFTYKQPMAKQGFVASTVMVNYAADNTGSALAATVGYYDVKDANGNRLATPLPSSVNGVSVTQIGLPSYAHYLEGPGQFKGSDDTWTLSLRINWEVPVYRKARLFGDFTVSQLLNAKRSGSAYFGSSSSSSSTMPIGRVFRDFAAGQPGQSLYEGTYNKYLAYDNPRSFSDVSVGIRF